MDKQVIFDTNEIQIEIFNNSEDKDHLGMYVIDKRNGTIHTTDVHTIYRYRGSYSFYLNNLWAIKRIINQAIKLQRREIDMKTSNFLKEYKK